ncbi:hypothetical protein [Kitasatospora herbaricolor]|uniref:Uncharacterized protein n=1 Tax=Kitasatospora herbaricolor TaxID=68217 RepID=A0ABZ1WG37_9ACTN|nr:hypothetical protein [Kitasatospora herbaricolor]
MEYEFTFVVAGADVDDETSVDALRDQLDAMLARAGGLDLLSVSYEGENAVRAALTCASEARAVVPHLRILRLDRDLVGVHEIADRTGRSRQNIAQWVSGDRKAGGTPFPPPEGTAGRSSIWLWTEVNRWLEQHGLNDEMAYPSRAEMTEIDFALANAVALSFHAASSDEAFAEARSAVVDELETSHIPGFMALLGGLEGATDPSGRHVLVVAAEGEPAVDVIHFLAGFEHLVILVTKVDSDFICSVMSPRVPPRPTKVVEVPLEATVRDWMKLLKEHPRTAFTPAPALTENDSGPAPAPIQRVLEIAA